MNRRTMLILIGGSGISLAVALSVAQYGAAFKPAVSASASVERSAHAH